MRPAGLSSLDQKTGQGLGRSHVLTDGLGRHDVPFMRSKRPADVRQAAERLMRPSRFTTRREDHEALRRSLANLCDVQNLVVSPEHRDRLIDERSMEEGFAAGHTLRARAAISLSRTARSPASEDLILYETSPV